MIEVKDQRRWSEGFPEKVAGSKLVTRESRSQPREEKFQEEGNQVQGSGGLERA